MLAYSCSRDRPQGLQLQGPRPHLAATSSVRSRKRLPFESYSRSWFSAAARWVAFGGPPVAAATLRGARVFSLQLRQGLFSIGISAAVGHETPS